MKKTSLYIVISILVIALVLIKIYVFPAQKSMPAAKGPAVTPAVNVTAIVAHYDTLGNEIFIAGTLNSNESVDLQPETQGKVTAIYFSEGQRVNQGALLVKLNDAELQASLKKTEAQIKLAAEKENRLKKLLEISGVSREEYENALNQLQSLQADAQITQARIAQTEIRAPFSGIVGLKYISVGSFVNSGSKIATLEQLDQVKLDLSVPEKYAGLIKVGDMVKFSIDGAAGTFSGRVYAADPRIDPDTRSLKLRAICSNPGGVLRSGAFARVELTLNNRSNAIMVPTQALVPDMKGQKLFLCHNGKSEPRVVKTGLRTADKIEITEGVQPGDSIIVMGVMQVKPGQKINVINAQ